MRCRNYQHSPSPLPEFSTLREKFDFLLVGESGEIPCETRSAALLARKLLELEASAVVDMSGLPLADRRRFVRLFLESLIALPKTLWRPLIVMLDEAHLFCPERSSGEAESTNAVINLMSLGRKRSYCGILATQRLSKLHKDAEAETNNVFIGRTWLDLDQGRAGKLLGIQKKEELLLRDLPPGTFHAFGPALSKDGVNEIVANKSETTHPKAGQRHKLTPPKPSEAVKRIVADLADLPQQAEAEIRGLDDAKKKIRELEQQLRARPVEKVPEVKTEYIEVPVLKNGLLNKASGIMDRMAKLQDQLAGVFDPVKEAFSKVATAPPPAPTLPIHAPKPKPAPIVRPPVQPRPAATLEVEDGELTKTQHRILDTVAMLYNRGLAVNRDSVARWQAIHPNGGRYGSDLARLRELGFLEGFMLTSAGNEQARPLPTGPQACREALPDETKRRLFDRLLEDRGTVQHSRETLAQAMGIHPNGGRYGSDLAWFRTMGIIPDRGPIVLTDGVFA